MPAQPNRNPDEQRQPEEPRQRAEPQTPSTRPVWRSLWLWPVLVVLVGLLWWGFWGGGWFWNRRHEGGNNIRTTANNQLPAQNGNQAEAVTNPNSNTGAAVLSAANKQEYIGQAFEIVRTPVLRKVSEAVFWLGTNNDPAPLLVVLANRAQNGSNANLRQGETVNVVGQVEKAPTLQQATQRWHLTRAGAERLQREGAYIQASQAIPPQNVTEP